MIVVHRVNSIDFLKKVPSEYSLEIDIRYDPKVNDLVVSHDVDEPNKPLLKDWLKYYKHANLFLDIKESQCEDLCIEIMKEYSIDNWYFLDSQIPDIVRLSKKGYGDRFISRHSRFEVAHATLLNMTSKFVWIDDFGNEDSLFAPELLVHFNKELVYCSPELHGKTDRDYVKQYRKNLITMYKDLNETYSTLTKHHTDYIHICTDYPTDWQSACLI